VAGIFIKVELNNHKFALGNKTIDGR